MVVKWQLVSLLTFETPSICIVTAGLQDTNFTIKAEDLLLTLSSNFLKRNIQLIPYFGDEVKQFGKRFSHAKSYCLLAYQYATTDNFFLSAFTFTVK